MKKTLTILSLVFAAGQFYGQQQAQLSLYNFHPQLVNPSHTGIDRVATAVGGQRFQWIGIDGFPRTTVISLGYPVKLFGEGEATRASANSSFGLGATLVQERIGSLNTTGVFLDAAYATRVNNLHHILAFGLKFGGDFMSINMQELDVLHQDDALRNNYINKFVGNVGFGVSYYAKDFFVSVGLPKLLRTRLDDIENVNVGRQINHAYVYGGYNVELSADVSLVPTMNVKMAINSPISTETSLNLFIFDKFWTSAMYRLNDAVGLNFVMKINSQISAGYAYDYSISLENARVGSHELMVGYNVQFLSDRFKGVKTKNPKIWL
ncbi:MAG: PorP/SprF family type IX secretion system membrane protein [Flavobacteriales bacterium]|nr:PorP/SprF family type IX secretion system membrane protein [Flavobacteriales bacterium]